jgi:hypothetical protein
MADHRDQIDRVRRDALFANCAPLQLARVLGKLEPFSEPLPRTPPRVPT